MLNEIEKTRIQVININARIFPYLQEVYNYKANNLMSL